MPPAAASSGTINRFPSRTYVTQVSLRTHRGFDSEPVVRVIWRRSPRALSTRTTSPPSTNRTRRWALSQRLLGGGADLLSSSAIFLQDPLPRLPTFGELSAAQG